MRTFMSCNNKSCNQKDTFAPPTQLLGGACPGCPPKSTPMIMIGLKEVYKPRPIRLFHNDVSHCKSALVTQCTVALSCIVIVIVNSKHLKRHSKAKRRAPVYSRALRQIRGVFQRIVRGRLRSGGQRVRECVKSEGFSKE